MADLVSTPVYTKMHTISTMNNAHLNLSQDESEMAESPVIPKLLAQNYPRPQQPAHSSPVSRGLAIDRLKSRVPDATNPALVPVPLFSSAKCSVDAETIATTGLATITTTSPTSNAVTTTASPTPISPSPSLFPVPPSHDGIVARPVSIASPAPLHAPASVLSPSSVYSQNGNGHAMAVVNPPRPVSSIYSQNTMSTIVATSTPCTPTLTNWASVLPGLRSPEPPFFTRTQMSTDAHSQSEDTFRSEQISEERPVPQQIQVQFQVPRLRSPSLPQDWASRRRAISNPVSIQVHGKALSKGSINSMPPAVRSPEPAQVPQPTLDATAGNYEGGDWPLPKLSVVRDMPRKQHGHQSQGSGVTRYEPFIGHAANKDSVSSLSFTATPGHLEHPGPDFVSPRVSLADSLTPLSGPGEQRSGWFSDDEDIEQGRVRGSGYADVGTREKQVDTQSRRVRKIKVIVGVSILVLLIVVGVVLGVVFGVQGKKDKIGRTVTRI